jgi:hypothetical protein
MQWMNDAGERVSIRLLKVEVTTLESHERGQFEMARRSDKF